jgi:hypothetical protein
MIALSFASSDVALVYAQGAQGAYITQLNAPITVAAGQSFTVSLTVTFVAQPSTQALAVVIQDSSDNLVNSTISCGGTIEHSVCYYSPSQFEIMPATLTFDFTLTAPSSATIWNLKAVAVIVQGDASGNLEQIGTSSLKPFQVQVTARQPQSTTQVQSTAQLSTKSATSNQQSYSSTTSSPISQITSQSTTTTETSNTQFTSTPFLSGALIFATVLLVGIAIVAVGLYMFLSHKKAKSR